jgi:hypothetical protein
MTGTNCDLFSHNQSRSYLNHLVLYYSTTFVFNLLSKLLFAVMQPFGAIRRVLQMASVK